MQNSIEFFTLKEVSRANQHISKRKVNWLPFYKNKVYVAFKFFKKHCPEIFSAGLHFVLELKMKNIPVTMGFHSKYMKHKK